jgi:hypothetical protein
MAVIAIAAPDHDEQGFSGWRAARPLRGAVRGTAGRTADSGGQATPPGQPQEHAGHGEKILPGQPPGSRAESPLPYREAPQISVTTGTSLNASRHDSPHGTFRHSPLTPPTQPSGQIPPSARHLGPPGERPYSIAVKVALRYQRQRRDCFPFRYLPRIRVSTAHTGY